MFRKISSSALAILAAQFPMSAWAQTVEPQPPEEELVEGERQVFSNEIVVTGRAGGADLRQVEASYAITVIDSEALRLDAMSQYDTFWLPADHSFDNFAQMCRLQSEARC